VLLKVTGVADGHLVHKPKHCHFQDTVYSMTEKTNSGVRVSQVEYRHYLGEVG